MALLPNRPATKRAAVGGVTAAGLVCSVALISHWEGTDYRAVHHSFDPRGVVTACHGQTNLDDKRIRVGMRFTKAECDQMLAQAVVKWAERIAPCVPHLGDYGPRKQAAIVSFSYNLGPGKVCGGAPVGRLLNAGRDAEACDYMTHYERAAGRELPGLVARREDGFWGERAWCLRSD